MKIAARELKAGDILELIVTATAGMLRKGIEEIATRYRDGLPLPPRPDLDFCRNPDTGEYAERMFDPFALAGMLRKRGFNNIQVRHWFRRFPLNLLNGIQFKPLNKYLFNIRPQFIVYGERS